MNPPTACKTEIYQPLWQSFRCTPYGSLACPQHIILEARAELADPSETTPVGLGRQLPIPAVATGCAALCNGTAAATLMDIKHNGANASRNNRPSGVTFFGQVPLRPIFFSTCQSYSGQSYLGQPLFKPGLSTI